MGSDFLFRYTSVHFLNQCPSLKSLEKQCGEVFIICDRRLKEYIPWDHSSIYFVSAGENLKDLNHFPILVTQILKSISKKASPPKAFVGVGGGSVTDFVGFFSSIYKRGIPVYFIPTTLLSSIDASHGGKTALNAGSVKNVLGTYHFPEKIFIIKSLIETVKSSEISSAYGELLKISLVHQNKIYAQLKKKRLPSFEFIWKLIKEAVHSKQQIVKKDPFEQKGVRRILNFGHTFGHCLESYHKIPHGKAVAMGMLFSIEWSVDQKLLRLQLAQEIKELIDHYTRVHFIRSIPIRSLEKLLKMDKKIISSQKIEFVFLKNIGNPVIKKVLISDILKFSRRI